MRKRVKIGVLKMCLNHMPKAKDHAKLMHSDALTYGSKMNR